MKRRQFLISAGVATAGSLIDYSPSLANMLKLLSSLPTFTFARVRYSSGNWDTDAAMPEVVYRTLSGFTTLRTDTKEQVVGLDSAELLAFPFAYLSGNSVVSFTRAERDNLVRFVNEGGFVFVDDCNHDIQGTFARTFEDEMAAISQATGPLNMLPPEDELYRAFFNFAGGPPQTRHETNSWGDGQIHNYLQAARVNGRMAVLYSNKDYGCEWHDAANSLAARPEPSTLFAANIIVHALMSGKQKTDTRITKESAR